MGTEYGNRSIVTSGLTLCLDAGNLKSYPTSGTTWTDLSKNGNNGTLVNGPTFNSSNSGNLRFSTDDYVRITNSNSFKTNQFTIDMWIYFNSYADGDITTFGVGSGNVGQWYFRMYSNTTTNLEIVGTNKLYILTQTDVGSTRDNLYPLNTWLNVVIPTDFDNQDSKIYINGELKRTLTSTSTTNRASWTTADLYIAGFSWDGYTNTNFGSYKFYNRRLSASEVLQNYNATKWRFQ
jgi:hypothetical protein